MINAATLIQLKAYARQDGLLLGLFWTASFALTMIAPQSIWGNVLALATPFFMGWRLCAFRDGALEGSISFRRGLAWGIHCIICASLVFALVQYVYFRFFDNGTFMNILSDGVRVIEQLYEQRGLPTAELAQGMEAIRQVSPAEWAFVLMMQNVFLGGIVAIPVAAACARARK